MAKTTSVLEINGHRYDALKGTLIRPAKTKIQPKTVSVKKMVDGFVIAEHNKRSVVRPTKKSRRTPSARLSAQKLHATAERSNTLMRRVVKKPSVKAKSLKSLHTRKLSVNPAMRSRAGSTPKNVKVKRFGWLAESHFEEDDGGFIHITPTLRINPQGTAAPPAPLPSMVTSVSHRKLEKLLDEALLKADAHKQALNQRKHGRLVKKIEAIPKWITVSIFALLITVVASFLIWQNLPSIAMHLAASRAHVKASLPTYTPAGFSLASPLSYQPGSVSLIYKEASPAPKSFTLTQKASSWDSGYLASSTLPVDSSIQTTQVKGTTVYIYGPNNNAVWVNHGVKYALNNKANLSSDQILKIVQGL